MDPESFLPFALVVAGFLGVISRRMRKAQSVAEPTIGQKMADAGGSVSRGTAAGLGATGRAGVTGASKLAAGAGAATSSLAGLVVDGGVASVNAVGGAMARGAGRAMAGATHALFPRSRASQGTDGPGAGPTSEPGEHIMVITSTRGKRFHRPSCSLAPVGTVAIPRDVALATARQPCPTCQP